MSASSRRHLPSHPTAPAHYTPGLSGPIAGVIVSALGYPPIFLFAAAMVGSSMALLITLYLKRAEPNQLANTLSPAPARPVRSLPCTAQQFALSGTVSDLDAGRGCRGTGHVSDMEDER